jgi:hypothetical protein
MSKKRMTLEELQRIKTLNEERLQDVKLGEALIARSQALSIFLERIEPTYRTREDYEYNYPFSEIGEKLSCFRWAYPITTAKVATTEVDRMAPMLIGPIFTSDRHPWPRHGKKFREPIVQFDLEWAGKLANVNLGTGVLQLWLGPSFDDREIRIIPKEDFDPRLLTAIPKGVNRSYFAKGPFFAGDVGSWLDKRGGGEAVVITGTGKPTMTWPSGLYEDLDDLAYNMNDENAPVIAEFLEFLPADSASPTPHFFGNFLPIQYSPNDMPPCLLALESQGPFIWGDCGNAQIFYIPQDGGTTKFHFEWSCQ